MSNPAAMQRTLEAWLRGLIAASVPAIKVNIRGEPGNVSIPVDLHPAAVTYIPDTVRATGQEGFGGESGITHWAYSGYWTVEALARDTDTLVPGAGRLSEVASYQAASDLLAQALEVVLDTIGDDGAAIRDFGIVSVDGSEIALRMVIDRTSSGEQNRADNVSSRAGFWFTIYTARVYR